MVEQWVRLLLDLQYLVIHTSCSLFKSKSHIDTPKHILSPSFHHGHIELITLLSFSLVSLVGALGTSTFWSSRPQQFNILHGALVPVLHIETNVQTSNLAHFTLKLQLGTGYYLGLVLP